MWIIKLFVGLICIVLCLIGALLLAIPALLMGNVIAANNYFGGVWATYNDFFMKYDEIDKRNTTVD